LLLCQARNRKTSIRTAIQQSRGKKPIKGLADRLAAHPEPFSKHFLLKDRTWAKHASFDVQFQSRRYLFCIHGSKLSQFRSLINLSPNAFLSHYVVEKGICSASTQVMDLIFFEGLFRRANMLASCGRMPHIRG
jgi:hypothetical protein